jgi:uncharacterized protein YbaP (TraB family)
LWLCVITTVFRINERYDMNRKSIMAVLLLSITFLVYFPVSAAAENVKTGKKDFLWKVSSKNSTAYLFGSIHVAKPEFYPLAPTIEKCFGKAHVLAFEADPKKGNDPDLQRRMVQSALYTGDDTLKRHLSQETYDIAAGEMQRIGLPVDAFSKAKPWFLALTIGILELQRLGYNQEYGIDRYFAGKAGGKKIVQLESFDYQINLLNGFTDREQELFLLYTIRDMKNMEKYMDRMVLSWRTGDAKTMESILAETMNEFPELQPIYEKLYYRRNREMTRRIEQYLQSGDTYFIVVGAAHLIGERGILELLRKRGYAVEQL